MTPRAIGALAALLAAAGIVAAVQTLPQAAAPRAAAARLPLAPGAADLACPGPETLIVPDGGAQQRPKGDITLAVMAADASGTANEARLLVRPLPPAGRKLPDAQQAPAGNVVRGLDLVLGEGGIVGGLLSATSAGGSVVEGSSPDARGVAPLLAGLQATVAQQGDLRGLASTACAPAAPETWLVGGATGTGHRLRLVLTNPSATTAVADIEVLGPDGRVEAPSGQGVVVPARTAKAVFVDALAPDLDRTTVHVTARSGRVHATLHEAVLRGIVPAGTDDVPPAAAPARRQVVPGIAVGPGGGEQAPTAIRVTVPGAEEAVVRVRLIGPEGEVDLRTPAVSNVGPGAVADVPLTGVPAGSYAAVVDSDVPVVAGAVVRRGGNAGRAEFGWTAGATPLQGPSLIAMLPSTRRQLAMSAPGEYGEVHLREIAPGGRLGPLRDLDVDAGTTQTLGVAADTVGLLVTGVDGGPVYAALVQTVPDSDGELISVLPLAPGPAAEAPAPVAIQDPLLGTER